MKAFREVTVWEDNTPNHDYVLNDAGKVVAYRKAGTKDWLEFSKPLPFSRSYRKFKELKDEQLRMATSS
jgi:hypothetical protein